jgi:hypothetical protein
MMPNENGWHLAEAQLADYASGRSTVAQAASAETHMTACARCRSRLEGVLPELPIERMWRQILAATDPAPPGRPHHATGRTRMRPWMTFFPVPVFGPQRIGIAVLTLVLGLTLVLPLAYPRDDSRSAGGRTPGAGFARATAVPPPRPETLQRDHGTIRLPRKGAVKRSITVVPPTSHAPQAPPSLPRQLQSPGPTQEPHDRMPWRSGGHPE